MDFSAREEPLVPEVTGRIQGRHQLCRHLINIFPLPEASPVRSLGGWISEAKRLGWIQYLYLKSSSYPAIQLFSLDSGVLRVGPEVFCFVARCFAPVFSCFARVSLFRYLLRLRVFLVA